MIFFQGSMESGQFPYPTFEEFILQWLIMGEVCIIIMQHMSYDCINEKYGIKQRSGMCSFIIFCCKIQPFLRLNKNPYEVSACFYFLMDALRSQVDPVLKELWSPIQANIILLMN